MLNEQGINLRDIHESIGTIALYFRLLELMESKDDKPPRLRPEDFSLREIYEQVGSTAFPTITGALFSTQVIKAYNSVPRIGEKLVHVVPSNDFEENIVGFTALEQLKPVEQGMPYEQSSFAEKKVKITNHKYGRILALTKELVQFDKTGQVLAAAADFGRRAAIFKEKLIMDVVRDVNSTSYNGGVLYKSDAGYGNFDSTAFGSSGEGLTAVKLLLRDMKDETGDPILIAKHQLLLPEELVPAGHKLLNPPITDTTYFKQIVTEILTSPYMDIAAEYLYGDFVPQFRYQEVWPFEVSMAKPGNEDEFDRDTYAKYKVSLFGGCGAIDTKYVIRSEG